MKTHHGTIHGRTIQLDLDPGLAEGQEIEVFIQPATEFSASEPGSGLLRTEGALADDPWWDDIMDEIRKARKLERPSPAVEP